MARPSEQESRVLAEFEVYGAVRDFVERGGDVLLVIAFVTAAMWMLIYERFWYFRTRHRVEIARITAAWNNLLYQMRGFVHAIWDMIDRVMHSPLAGPTVSGRAVLIQAGLLAFLLLIGYVAAR